MIMITQGGCYNKPQYNSVALLREALNQGTTNALGLSLCTQGKQKFKLPTTEERVLGHFCERLCL